MSSYVNCLGDRCPHMPFFIGRGGGHMSGGDVLHSKIPPTTLNTEIA